MDVWEEVAPLDERELRDEHREILVDQSGISDEIVDGRGYYSPTRIQMKGLIDLGLLHKSLMKAQSWLAIPVFRPDGVKHCEQFRLIGSDQKMKYVWPTGYRTALDVHPTMLEYLQDHTIPVIFTEGIKKADSILTASMMDDTEYVVIAVHGCFGWRAKTDGGSIAVPDFQDIPLAKRRVYVVSDSDFRTNNLVRKGWTDCATYLSSKTGESRSLLVVVPSNGVDKQGADDFLVTRGSLQDLLGYAATPDQAVRDAPLELDIPLEIMSGMAIIRSATDKIPHIITPLLPKQAITVMAGQSGSLKTWSAIALILDGAFGKKYLDHPDMEQDVASWKSLYINKEMGGTIFSNRMAGMARNPRFKDSPDWEKILDEHVFSLDKIADFDLAKETSRNRLEEAISELGVQVVILDSLSMSWSGEENDNSEVGILYAQLRGITERTGVSWIIIHHTLKPSSTRKKDPLMFSIRGAGQIVQQADTAILLSPASEGVGDPAQQEVTVAFVKTRTAKEPPRFLARLTDHDGLYMSLMFVATLTEARAGAYAASTQDPTKLQAWVEAEILTLPAMLPTGPGIRMPQLLPLLRMQWPIEDKNPPSETSIRRALDTMTESGELQVVDHNKRLGNLLRLPDPEEVVEDIDITEENIVPFDPSRKRKEKKGKSRD